MHVIALSEENLKLGYTEAVWDGSILSEMESRSMLAARMADARGAADAAARALDVLLAVAGSRDGLLSLYSTLDGQFTTEVRAGAWERASFSHDKPAGNSIARFVLQTGVPYSAGYSGQCGELSHPAWFFGVENIVCVPLISQSERVGVLWVGRRQAFEPEKIRLLTLLGQNAALLIRQARDFFAYQPGD